MRTVFKCTECDTGPCYCEALNAATHSDGGYQSNIESPCRCPYYSDSHPEWEPLPFEINAQFCDELLDWLGGEGYEKVPRELSDAIYNVGMDGEAMRRGARGVRALNLLRELDKSWHREEREPHLRELLKRTKLELLQELLPAGFQAGIVYACKYFNRLSAENQKEE